MSLRSRAFLTGMAKGFFQSNNERRAKMAERIQQLSTNRAEMDRERTKSRAAAIMKEAQAEESKITSLRSAGHLDQEGLEYTDTYWNDQTRDIWKESQFTTQQEFIDKYYKQNRPTAFKREFKDTSEIQRNLSGIEKAIQMRQSDEMNQSASTPLDRLLSFGALQEEGGSAVEVPELDAKSTQGPVDTYEDKGVTLEKQQESKTLSEIVKNEKGEYTAVFASNEPGVQQLAIPLGVKAQVPTTDRKVTQQRLFSVGAGQLFGGTVPYDINNNQALVNGEWISVNNDEIRTAPVDIKVEEVPFTNDNGEEFKVKMYEVQGYTEGAVQQPDGRWMVPLGGPTTLRGIRDQHEGLRPKISKALQNENVQYRNHQNTMSLIEAFQNEDFISNPATWIAGRLSTLTDVIGSSIGLEGDRANDLEAITEYAKNEWGKLEGRESLRGKVGLWDAAAVREGQRDAIQNFLTFALARSHYGEGKLTVQAVEMADDLISPFFTGTSRNVSAIERTRIETGEKMGRALSTALETAVARNFEDPMAAPELVELYPRAANALRYAQRDNFDLKNLVVGRPSAQSFLRNLNDAPEATRSKIKAKLAEYYGTKWEKELTINGGVFYSKAMKSLVAPIWKKSESGVFSMYMIPLT